jgi:hypothetical protein
MFNRHISESDLLLAMDAELSPQRQRTIQAHLAACGECRERMNALAAAADSLHAAYREGLDAQLPAAGAARASLRARISAEDLIARSGSLPQLALFPARWAYTLSVVAVAALAVGLAYSRVWLARPGRTIVQVNAAPRPKPSLTPGSAVKLPNDICFVEHKEDAGAIPVAERKEVFREYGIDYRHAGDYELDHLITPALGGTNDIQNLWPQPYAETEWNAHVKDQIEDALHDMVCSGQVDLPTAQHDIATDWIAAYKKYFHTETPLPRRPDLDAEPEPAHPRNSSLS